MARMYCGMRIADCGLIADLPIRISAFRIPQYDRPAMSERLARQIAFLVEADKLKSIDRRTPLTDGSRAENSAEHSWHLGLAALTLSEYAGRVDVPRVLELLAIHDLVEIDAGDTFAYDVAANDTKAERERAAASRIFGLLPPDQAARLHAAWAEFEAFETREVAVCQRPRPPAGAAAEHAGRRRQLDRA